VPDLPIGVTILVGVIVAVIVKILNPDIERLRTWIRQDNPISRRLRRRRAEADARRLLRAIRARAGGRLDATIAIEKAANQADVDDPGPALVLLSEQGLINLKQHGTRLIYVTLTPKGLRDAEDAV
jgi:hypothetical protein